MNDLPLSEKLRPKVFSEIFGQSHLLSSEGFITKLLKHKKPISLLLWGPPGCGKTSLAKLYCQSFDFPYFEISPLSHGVSEVKKLIEKQSKEPLFKRQIMIFVDEIHRFNKAQQDVFLPYVEKGQIILVGATTENPSFSLNSALLSRLRVLPLKPLKTDALEKIMDRYISRSNVSFQTEAKKALIELSSGDGRHLINLLENISAYGLSKVDLNSLKTISQKKLPDYDKNGDQHYNFISALHKSIRGSDPQAALYWVSRMLYAGEDPKYILRRLARMASEDIGLADPEAISIVINALKSYELLGSPEGDLTIAQAVVYLALAPKSNKVYEGFKKAFELAKKTAHLPPPKHLLTSHTKLAKDLGHGKDYKYDHDMPSGCSGQNYFPDELPRDFFYEPIDRGFEREMKKRLSYFDKFRKK